MSGSPFSREETATILAALRFWQAADSWPPRFVEIATDEESFDFLTQPEIDDLCEKVNFL